MLMKDGLGVEAIERIATALKAGGLSFNRQQFVACARNGLDTLELKERVAHLIDVLHQFLPTRFVESSKVLRALPKVWPEGDPDNPTNSFAAWPLIDYVAKYGAGAPKTALKTLEVLTPLFTAEFAIRPFIMNEPSLTFEYFRRWLTHKNPHVRRLVSEGTRPRLPWAMQLKPYIEDPTPSLPLLEALRLDESEYVRRSVANHLNDIAKDHPHIVLNLCKKWQRRDKGKSDWVIRHGTRSLVKAGHPSVFALLGYTEAPALKLSQFELDHAVVTIGETIAFSVLIEAQADVRCVVDFAVHYMKANGRQAPKVFKLKNLELSKGQTATLAKSVSFKKITTRRFHPGEHAVALHVNGQEVSRLTFDLVGEYSSE